MKVTVRSKVFLFPPSVPLLFSLSTGRDEAHRLRKPRPDGEEGDGDACWIKPDCSEMQRIATLSLKLAWEYSTFYFSGEHCVSPPDRHSSR